MAGDRHYRNVLGKIFKTPEELDFIVKQNW